MTRISIITPSYNQGEFIERTIKSVLNQGYENIEYIIIDGGSSDSTVGLLKKYDEHIAYWVSEPDNGQTEAINKGLMHATGDVLAYLNSDDVLFPGALHFIDACFKKHKDADLIYGDCVIFDQNDRFLHIKREIDFDYSMGCMIGFGLITIQPSTFFRRSVLEDVGYFDETLHYIMDGDYWYRCASRGKRFKHMPEIFSGFRWHTSSKTMSDDSRVVEKWQLEKHKLSKAAYESLPIARLVPFDYSTLLRKIYRLKRVGIKLIRGCYFNTRDQSVSKAFTAFLQK